MFCLGWIWVGFWYVCVLDIFVVDCVILFLVFFVCLRVVWLFNIFLWLDWFCGCLVVFVWCVVKVVLNNVKVIIDGNL